MRKIIGGLLVAGLLCMSLGNTAFALEQEEMEINKVELTEDQVEELAVMTKNIFTQKKELIKKYVEFGILTEEKAEKIISKFDKHYDKLEENGFVPNWDKHKHKKCRE